jgi:hypothetical protein
MRDWRSVGPDAPASAAAGAISSLIHSADVADLVDAHGSGPCPGNWVEVRVLSSAPFESRRNQGPLRTGVLAVSDSLARVGRRYARGGALSRLRGLGSSAAIGFCSAWIPAPLLLALKVAQLAVALLGLLVGTSRRARLCFLARSPERRRAARGARELLEESSWVVAVPRRLTSPREALEGGLHDLHPPETDHSRAQSASRRQSWVHPTESRGDYSSSPLEPRE